MDRDAISLLAHSRHAIKAPVGDAPVLRLLGEALPAGAERVLDLGCGTAEWLLRALTERLDLRAEGVDLSEGALAGAREAADARGVGDRLTLHAGDAGAFTAPYRFDTVVSVGAAHAFGGLLPALEAARRHLAPGGRVLIGDGYWESEPSAEAVALLGDFSGLATTLDRLHGAGWTPVHAHLSTRHELDDYEWTLWGTVNSWALDHPEDTEAAGLLALAADRLAEWLRVYRASFGFFCMVLRRTDG